MTNEGGHLKRGNLLWESSRMILPEHKEQYLEHRRTLQKRRRADLDESLKEEFSRLIRESHEDCVELSVCVYEEFQERTIRGTVLKIDPPGARIRLAGEWIRLDDIVRLERPAEED